MSLIPSECIEFNEKRKICIAFENGKTYRLNNGSGYKVKKIRIDNCIAQKVGEKRCDFVMEIAIIRRVIFIELKGGDLVHALKQLYSTITYLKREFENYRIDARIIGSRDVPGFINIPDYRRLMKELLPEGTIWTRTNICTENI